MQLRRQRPGPSCRPPRLLPPPTRGSSAEAPSPSVRRAPARDSGGARRRRRSESIDHAQSPPGRWGIAEGGLDRKTGQRNRVRGSGSGASSLDTLDTAKTAAATVLMEDRGARASARLLIPVLGVGLAAPLVVQGELLRAGVLRALQRWGTVSDRGVRRELVAVLEWRAPHLSTSAQQKMSVLTGSDVPRRSQRARAAVGPCQDECAI